MLYIYIYIYMCIVCGRRVTCVEPVAQVGFARLTWCPPALPLASLIDRGRYDDVPVHADSYRVAPELRLRTAALARPASPGGWSVI